MYFFPNTGVKFLLICKMQPTNWNQPNERSVYWLDSLVSNTEMTKRLRKSSVENRRPFRDLIYCTFYDISFDNSQNANLWHFQMSVCNNTLRNLILKKLKCTQGQVQFGKERNEQTKSKNRDRLLVFIFRHEK